MHGPLPVWSTFSSFKTSTLGFIRGEAHYKSDKSHIYNVTHFCSSPISDLLREVSLILLPPNIKPCNSFQLVLGSRWNSLIQPTRLSWTVPVTYLFRFLFATELLFWFLTGITGLHMAWNSNTPLPHPSQSLVCFHSTLYRSRHST